MDTDIHRNRYRGADNTMTTNKDLKDGILPCPIQMVKIVSPGYDEYYNLILTENGFCAAMLPPGAARPFLEMIEAWNTRSTPAIADGVGAEWKQTVRDLYDMMHFGEHNTFNNPNLSKIVEFIEDRHRNYFLSPPQSATDEGV